jgi:uncharacterized protein YaiL (DUF2058 family)
MLEYRPYPAPSRHSRNRNAMALSLKDQLLKAGLADAKKARKAEHEKRVEARDPAATSAQALAQQALAEKAERDRELNRQQKLEQDKKALVAQVRQIVETHRIERKGGDVAYQFTADKKIKKIHVTVTQQDQLVRGLIAVARLGEQFELVPAVIAEKLRQRDSDAVVVLNDKSSTALAEDDPYKDYPIPDDLMW